MSWDAIIAKTADQNFAKPADDALYLPMGSASSIQAKLNSALPELEWSSASEGYARSGTLSLEFSLLGKMDPNGSESRSIGINDEVESISVAARGSGDPVALLVVIAKANEWSVADTQEGAWIDLNAPSQATWQQFTEYRDRLQQGSPPGSSPSGGSPSAESMATNLMISCAVFVILALAIWRFPARTERSRSGSRR